VVTVDITVGIITHGVSTTITVGADTDMVDLDLAWDTDTADIMDTVDTAAIGTIHTMDTDMVVTTEAITVVATATLNETPLITKPTDVQIHLWVQAD
jgi:hypothetical protein